MKGTEPSPRKILGPGWNRARVSGPPKPVSIGNKVPASEGVVRKNGSVDSCCSTLSSFSSSSSSSSDLSVGCVKKATTKMKEIGIGSVKTKPAPARFQPLDSKRCDWITANSDPLYISFHDEEWGVVACEDDKLYELLVLSIALAEHTWVSILSKRDRFRALFDNFKPASVAKFSEEKLLSLCTDANALLSEQKLRAVVDNAKQILKVQGEFGSFSKYCWRFVNNQPMKNGYRYVRQVPIKTPKAELVSKDLIRRGFRCVGPTVVYSFMQASGMVNDHLMSCFMYEGCNATPKKYIKPRVAEEEAEAVNQAMNRMSIASPAS